MNDLRWKLLCTALVILPLGAIARDDRIEAHPSVGAGRTIALVGATIVPSPGADVIRDGVVLIAGDRIVAAGEAGAIDIPKDAERWRCEGDTVVSGFWNCHVHFTEPKWAQAATQPRELLAEGLREMLTSRGFTTVVDLASLLDNTVALRRRIESGELAGPRVLTAGLPIYPTDGVPYYVTESLPPEVVAQIPTPATADEAVRLVAKNFDGGADVLKLFLVTGVRRDGDIALVNMDAGIARAATAEAHRRGRLVFVHPSNIDGMKLALDAGVDVLAHAIQDPENLTDAMIARLVKADIAIIPTLTLFSSTRNAAEVDAEVGRFAAAGGRLLFGTDVGFLTDHDATDHEFELLAGTGLSFAQILAMLTTGPAREFGAADHVGRVAPGFDADLVVLDGQPEDGPKLFTQIARTIRAGRLLYAAPGLEQEDAASTATKLPTKPSTARASPPSDR